MRAYIGCDPGASGAIALLTDGGTMSVHDTPLLDDGQIDHWRLAAHLRHWVEAYVICGVVIEWVSAMPKQGVVSMFNFGVAYGAIRQAVASAGLGYTLVAPHTWKRVYGLKGGHDNKGASVAKAISLFPALEPLMYGPRGGVKDGRAEAALLAHYGSMRA